MRAALCLLLSSADRAPAPITTSARAIGARSAPTTRGRRLAAFSGLLSLSLLASSGAAWAGGPDMVVTAGGGWGGISEPVGCADGAGVCGRQGRSGSLLLGAGIFDVSASGVRGSVRVEGAFAFGKSDGYHANLLGVVGWQGRWLVVEGGMGSSALFKKISGHTTRSIGGLFHGGIGVPIGRTLCVLARGDLLIGQRLTGSFVGLAVEWLPLGSF